MRLIEVLVWSRQGTFGLSGGEVVLIVFLCIIGSGIWQAHRSGFNFMANGVDIWGSNTNTPSRLALPGRHDPHRVREPAGNIK